MGLAAWLLGGYLALIVLGTLFGPYRGSSQAASAGMAVSTVPACGATAASRHPEGRRMSESPGEPSVMRVGYAGCAEMHSGPAHLK